ncbi:Rne/Rng family ribonuclease [Devriesea agamarum]|uniref:Rne/Rng family ribonuclease n=1 Tax=Devriesea agamarum TaxID=472569 RepID=UPI00071C4B2C|nr:Rne/Rng family ribonuclease [Devriesea agamarum]
MAEDNATDTDNGRVFEEHSPIPTPRPKKPRRRAGAPAGPPSVNLADTEDSLSTPANSDAVPLTIVPEQPEVPVKSAVPTKRARRPRRRAGAPAGPPQNVELVEPVTAEPVAESPTDHASERGQNNGTVTVSGPAGHVENAAPRPTNAEGSGSAVTSDFDHEPGHTDDADHVDEDERPTLGVLDDLEALASRRRSETVKESDKPASGTRRGRRSSRRTTRTVPVETPDAEEKPVERPADRPSVQLDFSSLFFQAPSLGPTDTVEPTQPLAGLPELPVGTTSVMFDAGSAIVIPPRRTRGGSSAQEELLLDESADETDEDEITREDSGREDGAGEGGTSRRRRRRGGRGRRGRGLAREDSETSDAPEDELAGSVPGDDEDASQTEQDDAAVDTDDERVGSSSRRRRRRRRSSAAGEDAVKPAPDDPPNTVVKVREGRDEVKAVKGSTRLEAKKQRRREGRDAGRRRNVITEAEFLARREAVKRSMVVRESKGRTQIAVLEDDVLVEHYVGRKTQTSMVGNVYLGKVQNVLPSMEAAFVDIGKGRNAVLYAGEVNWDLAGLDGQPRRIENALKSGDAVLVQVTKDPIGHKGARLTSQISLPGRYLVFVPGASMTGISRKLPDTERSRLKKIMRQVIPEGAGVIVRTAAEGASEEELTRDVERLKAQWASIQKAQKSKSAPVALSQEPDLAIKVVRDVFNEDFTSLIVQGDKAWKDVHEYVTAVAPDLLERVTKHVGEKDVFAKHRIDEQLLKAMDRKVYLPSGGSLVIDRTEAMTVVDVNTGKFTGTGGSLEETVTKNNLEAAEEIVRQLRLRDIGGIIVVDFIDMVLESNRDLVLRRLVECLSRDRTKHQVAEVTSLGLVQMTRKRVGQGLVEMFSTPCEHCNGRGVVIDMDGSGPSEPVQDEAPAARKGRKSTKKVKPSGAAKDAVAELIEDRAKDKESADVHVLAQDEKSREIARATIASIAAATTQHGTPEVTVAGEVVAVGEDDVSD